MSRGKPPGERGDDEQQSTRVLAARAAGLVRGLIGRLERLEKYCLQTRTQELAATDELRRRVEALEGWCGGIQEQLAPALDQQRRNSVQVGLSSRQEQAARPIPFNAWEAIHGGTATGAAAEPGGATEAGGMGRGAEPLERAASGESAEPEGGAGAGGAAGGGAAGPVETAVTDNESSKTEP